MVLKLYTYTYFFASSAFKYYAVEDNGNSDIEKIYYFDEELDLEDPESYDVAIEFLNGCKECNCELYDTCDSPIIEALLGISLVSDLEKINDTINTKTDQIIEALTNAKNELLRKNELAKRYTDGCSRTVCPEVEKKSDPVEPVSNTETVELQRKTYPKTFELARTYIETVMDPAEELPDADYNVILTTLTNYGNWLLTQ